MARQIKFGVMQVCLGVGILAGVISAYQTLAFTWDINFQAPLLVDGPTHTNYHAFREALLAFGVNGLLVGTWVGVYLLGDFRQLMRKGWWVIFTMALVYYAGWWLAWPIWGYHAPEVEAEIVHLLGTVGGLVGLWLVRGYYDDER